MSQKIHPFNDRAAAFLKYEPIELNGLVYYPIQVVDYEKWQSVKPVLCLRQGTLPAVYACCTYLQCVWALERDGKERTGNLNGPWSQLACLMFMSLRLSDRDIIQPIGDAADGNKIKSMRIIKDGEAHDIQEFEFAQVRKLIADQNGAELPDEADNPDLIEAAEDMNNEKDMRLKYDFSDMLTSVSTDMKIRRSEILEWTVKEFEDVLRSIKRKYGHLLASVAESQGAKFPHGNPYPTWIFDKAKDEFAGLISLEKLQSQHNANISQSDEAPLLQS